MSAITDLQRIGIKLFTEEFSVDQQDFIGVFHRWIQEQSVQDHLLVDVADYSHVQNGPGILLVSHEANINSDETDGRPGLQYLRKQPLSGSFGERLGSVLHTAIVAAQRLEGEPELSGRLRFSRDEFLFIANDRLLAPNTDATFEALNAAVSESLRQHCSVVAIATSRCADDKGLLRIGVRGDGILA